MRFVPGTSRALFYNWSQKFSNSPAMGSLPSAIMFFEGAMPSEELIRQRFAAGMAGAARQANLYNVVNPHSAQCLGSVGWRQGITSSLGVDVNDIELQLGFQTDTLIRNPTPDGSDSDPLATRTARILRTGTPTWFALAVSTAGLNLLTGLIPVANNSTQIYIAIVGTVGDENSDKDLKLIGGTLYATEGTPVDLSKVPQIANLRLRLN